MRRRIDAALRRPRAVRTDPTGSIDRAQDGLVSGWFLCPTCRPDSHDHPLVAVNGQDVDPLWSKPRRSDVPGGRGFLARFADRPVTADATVRVACPDHPDIALTMTVPAAQWNVTVLGGFDNVVWPHVNGWIADLTDGGGVFTVDVDGRSVPIQASVSRPDVQEHLGSDGVGGFQLDLGPVLGYGVPDGTMLSLKVRERTLDTATVEGSMLGALDDSCLPPQRETFDVVPGLDARLRRHPDTWPEQDWRAGLVALGLADTTPEAPQWAAFLDSRGVGQGAIAGLLAQRLITLTGVPTVDPLPSCAPTPSPEVVNGLPERVQSWPAAMLRSPEGGTTAPGMATEARDRVCVAGLIEHRSGLGQNARHSLAALERQGIHACRAPFFPAPGSWNPRLAPTRSAARSLEDHRVLLHLPIDRVVESLAAQPSLMASPRLIGYFMWETEAIPREFLRPLDLMDEIWTATEFVADAYRAVTDTPVRVTGHAIDVSAVQPVSRRQLGIADDAFVVHASFDANSTVARKNPTAAIDAFHAAFDHDPDAVLLLKVRNYQQAQSLAGQGCPHARSLMARLDADPAIRLLTGEHGYGHTLGLIELSDAYVSLHRSEGFGYSLAEAMALGTPAIATGYGGNLDFMSPDESWLVPYELVEVLPGEYFYWEPGMQWAEPDVAAAAQALREVRSGTRVQAKVDAARTRIAQEATMDRLGRSYAEALLGS